MEKNTGPLTSVVLDEISLEGLDGITIPSLWKRVSVRLNLQHPLNEQFCTQMWTFLRTQFKKIEFYELPKPRPIIRVFNRYDLNETEAEYKECPFTVYNFNPINECGLMGSCEDYTTRQPIDSVYISELDLKQIESLYGDRFIIVGSQKLRESSILPDTLTHLTDITPFLYSIVERIGRSRYNGEKSNGKFSLSELFEAGKMHYIRKCLLKLKVIMRQPYYEKQGDHSCTGFLLHLPRFFAEFKTKQMILTEQIVNLLKVQPNHMIEYSQVKEMYQDTFHDSLKKLYKFHLFQKFIQTDVKVAYRTMHPNANKNEWRRKKSNEEKTLRVLQLRDPNADVNELWPHDIDEEEDEAQSFLDVSRQLVDVPLLKQGFDAIKNTKANGMSMMELGKYLGLSKLNVRSLIRNLERLKMITSYSVEDGRQKVSKYICTQYKESKQKKLESVVAEMDANTELEVTSSVPSTSDPSSIVKNETIKLMENNAEIIETQPSTELIYDQQDRQAFSPTPSYTSSTSYTPSVTFSQNDTLPNNAITFDIQQILMPPFMQSRKCITQGKLTVRMAKRMTIILRTIKDHMVVKDCIILTNKVTKIEQDLGYKELICKKSLYRLIARLSADKRIKLFNITLSLEGKTKTLLFICDTIIEPNHPKFQSFLESEKSKFLMKVVNEETRKAQEKKNAEKRRLATENLQQMTEKSKKIGRKIKTNNLLGFKYGFSPKFMRMRTLHEVLFYLIYDQSMSAEPIDPNFALNHWKQVEPLPNFNDPIPPVWSLEIGWKTFVPPLNLHAGYENGWALMTDVVNRLPLSLFVKIVNVGYEVEGLNELLEHPIRRHYLIKDIPTSIQVDLVQKKKHVYMIDETMRRLCCIGLLQIGPQWQKEKEQVFIYLNRNSNILDTISSSPGYATISEQEYPRFDFQFNSTDDLAKYWHELSRICLETPLGRRLRINERKEPIQLWLLRPDLVRHMESKTKEEILNSDDGQTPGDRYGAGGLDSSFYAHLLRNWSFNVKQKHNRPVIKPAKQETKTAANSSISRMRTNEAGSKINVEQKPLTAITVIKTSKTKRIVKAKLIRKSVQGIQKKKRVRSAGYTEIDRQALAEMTKLRVDWSAEEDDLILFCKVALLYMCPNPKKPQVHMSTIRDILHWRLRSTNKTSKACQRRALYMMKKPSVSGSVHMCVQDVKNNPNITDKFPPDIYERLRKQFKENEDYFFRALKIIFVNFVYFLKTHFVNLTTRFVESRENLLPETIDEFKAIYEEKSEEFKEKILKYSDPTSKHDIHVNTLFSLIHSSVCSSKDKTSWSIHLYDIYKDYPEVELAQAMRNIRNNQLISANKQINSAKLNKSKLMPLSSNPYHLSITYQIQMMTNISYEIFSEIYEYYKSILSLPSRTDIKFTQINGGRCIAMSQLLAFNNVLKLNVEIPKQMLVLDKTKCTEADDQLLERTKTKFRELFENVPELKTAVELKECEEKNDSNRDQEVKKKRVAINDKEKKIEYYVNPTEKIMKLDDSMYHFFCLLGCMGMKMIINDLQISKDKFCPFDCVLSKSEPIITIIDLIKANEEILRQINLENQIDTLPDGECQITEHNIILIFSILISKIYSTDESFEMEDVSDHGVLDIALDVLNNEDDENESTWFDNCSKLDDDNVAEVSDISIRQEGISDVISADMFSEKIHNFFYVSTCKISFDLLNTDSPLDEFKLNEGKKTELLHRLTSSDAIWIKNPQISDGLNKFFSDSEFEIAKQVFEFIESKQELGASSKELTIKFPDVQTILKIIQTLTTNQFVMRTGIKDFRYVHHLYVSPWMISSCHVKRLQKESLKPTSYRLMDVTGSGKRTISDINDHDKNTEHPNKSQRLCDSNDANKASDTPSTSGLRQRKLDKVTAHIDQSAIFQLPETLQQSKQLLMIMPWIRVNGSLNRRVIDKWLGVVLTYCICNPGKTILAICQRFNLLQPVLVRQLLEYLQQLDCIKMYVMKNRQTITLFSSYESIIIEPATELDAMDDVFVEVEVDAISKMAKFIGDKNYSIDFV